MHTYIAFTGKLRHMGGFAQCLSWGRQMVASNHTRICKIAKARKGVKQARLVAEITRSETRFLSSGRIVKLSQIMRRTNAQETN